MNLLNMTTLIIIMAIAFIFRYFRELEDETVRKPERNWAFFPNSDNGSTAKWKYPLQDYSPKWYHFGIKPKYKERFPYSSTVFVFLTDAEHFYQFVQTICLWVIVFLSQGSWYSLGAFVLGLMIAQVVKEKIKKIN